MANNNTDHYIPLGGAFTARFTPITLNGGSFNPSTQGGSFRFCIGKSLDNTFLKKDSDGVASGSFTITSTGVAVYVEPQVITASGDGTPGTYYTALFVYTTGVSEPITHLEKTIKIINQLPID